MAVKAKPATKKPVAAKRTTATPDPNLDNFWNFGAEPSVDSTVDPLWNFGAGSPLQGLSKTRQSPVRRAKAGSPLGGLDHPAPAMSFSDYLKQANEFLSGGGTDYSALMAQLKENAGVGDARLQAMYNQLRGSIDADAAPIAQTYDDAGAALAQSGQTATDQTTAGYQQARDAQTQQLAALGIGDAAGVLAANGGEAAADQAHAAANIAQNQQIGTDQNTQHKASALDYNTNIGNAAGLEGAVQRAGLQQDLANKLAELQSQQASNQGSNQSSSLSLAMQLMGMDQDKAAGQGAAAQQDFDNQLAAQKLMLEQAKAQGSGKTLEEALGQYNQLAQIAQQAGVGDDPAAFSTWLKNLQAAGKI